MLPQINRSLVIGAMTLIFKPSFPYIFNCKNKMGLFVLLNTGVLFVKLCMACNNKYLVFRYNTKNILTLKILYNGDDKKV